jgi:hypothetical protein
MKRFVFFKIVIGILLASFLFQGCTRSQKEARETDARKINDFESIKQEFKSPSARFMTATFWAWNGKITREKIEFQLEKMHEQHIGGVFVHPRPGMITEYMSDEYYEMVDYALKKAEELGMYLWLYDENSFPSGFAGGHVQAEMPESYKQGKGLRMRQTKCIEPSDTGWIYLAVERQESGFKDITASLEQNIGKPGDFFLFRKTANEPSDGTGGFPYPDLLVPGVTEKFISLTMEGYEKKFGKEFGKRIPGIFTDEPHIDPRTGENDIRWTPTLFRDFKKKWGYDLRPHLPSLFKDIGNYQKIRHNYYQLLIDLFVERWCKPWNEYTEEHDLKWTGHYWEHTWPNPRKAGDNMILYAYHQMPGIDMLMNNTKTRPDQFGNIMAGRELASVANQFGRNRTLSETYGAAGWSLGFEDMRRLGEWEYAAGVNFMNQHLFYWTLKGARKRDFPQSISYHAPWWPYYHGLVDYFGRLSMALSSGEQINHTLIMKPTTSTWMHFNPTMDEEHLGASGKVDQMGERFKVFLQDLETRQVEYDLGSEMVLRDFGSVEGNELVIGKRAYDLVILGPGMENVNSATADNLEKYLENGGKVISFGVLPQYSNGESTDRFEQLYSKYKDQWKRFNDWLNQRFFNLVSNEEIRIESEGPLTDSLYHHRRTLKDGQLIFWENFNENEAVNLEFRMKGKSVSLLDAMEGKIYDYPAEEDGKYRNIDLHIPPGQSKLFYLHSDSESPGEPYPREKSWKPLNTGDVTQVKREKPNVLVLDYCDLKIKGETHESKYYIDAADLIYKKHGFEQSRIDHNPWNFAIQYKTNILDKGNFAEGTGFEALFAFRTKPDFHPKDLQLAVEYGHIYKIEVNGQTVEPIKDEWWLDQSLDVYDLSEAVKSGTNHIRLKLHPMHIHAELERIFVIGDFGLEATDRGFVMKAPEVLELGSWRNQAMPFYFSEVAYSKEFTVKEKNGSYKVRLNQWNGTVAAVEVNGEEAGIIGWKPYELDITGQVHSGRNRLEVRVCGSLKNLLGPHYFVGTRGVVTPWSFNQAPENQPPGKRYDLLDYGLFNQFTILQEQ